MVELPANLARTRIPTGKNKRGFKVLFFGPYGSGKSFALSQFPKPILAIDSGEGGIGLYLDADAGDVCLEFNDPSTFDSALSFALAKEDEFASVVIDPVNHIWEAHMDFWSDKLGGDITGAQWRLVKGPWKANLYKLMRSKCHVGMAAWLRDIKYEQEERGPGIEGPLKIKQQEVPQVEKTTPYIFDLILQTNVETDRLSRATPFVRYTLRKGRRPRALSPKEFHVGKSWKFDTRKDPPTSTWDTIFSPLIEKWDEGAVDHLGFDPQDARYAMRDLTDAAADGELGRILRLIKQPFDSISAYKAMWDKEVSPGLPHLTKEHAALVQEAHDKKKAELAAKES